MDRQCSSCGGFCKKSGCERENTAPQQHKEPDPVAWCIVENGRIHGLVKSKPSVMNAEKWQPLYTFPPKKEWVGLTDEEIRNEAKNHVFDESFFSGAVWARGQIMGRNNG